jgi:hypothetical protein
LQERSAGVDVSLISELLVSGFIAFTHRRMRSILAGLSNLNAHNWRSQAGSHPLAPGFFLFLVCPFEGASGLPFAAKKDGV